MFDFQTSTCLLVLDKNFQFIFFNLCPFFVAVETSILSNEFVDWLSQQACSKIMKMLTMLFCLVVEFSFNKHDVLVDVIAVYSLF